MSRLFYPTLITLLLFGCKQSKFDHYKNTRILGQTPPSDMVFVAGQGKVPSFYVGLSEEPNINYVAYLNWLRNVYIDYPEIEKNARIEFKHGGGITRFNDPSLTYHMEHPAFAYYPVVGATWYQIQEYLRWKTDRLNESILIELGLANADPNQVNENNFSLEAYLYGQYNIYDQKNHLEDANGEARNVLWEDGIFLAGYRLPTEAEWELMEQENASNSYYGQYPYGREYPFLRWVSPPFTNRTDYYGNIEGMPDYQSAWKRSVIPDQRKISQYNNGIQGPYIDPEKPRPSNISGNVKEWLLDIYHDSIQTDWDNLAQYLWMNGFETREEHFGWVYDMDGIIDLKDSLGRLPFRILGVNTDGSPMWVIPPRKVAKKYLSGFRAERRNLYRDQLRLSNDYDLFFDRYKERMLNYYLSIHSDVGRYFMSSPYFYNDYHDSLLFGPLSHQRYGKLEDHLINHLYQDSVWKVIYDWGKQRWDKEFAGGAKYVDLVTLQRLYEDDKGNVFTLEKVPTYKNSIDAGLMDLRLVRGGTWEQPDFKHREPVRPDSSSNEIGFRCVIPYTSTPVDEKYRVHWK